MISGPANMINKSTNRPVSKPAAKTLYTPVFYGATPSSSASTSTSGLSKAAFPTPTAYLDYLSRAHISIAQIVQEVPTSRHGSPGEQEDDEYTRREARIEELRREVRKAYDLACGDPADGKWGLLVQLLRMGVTRGRYRWVGARADGIARSGDGWLNARTEAEWLEWEKKKAEEDRLKRKVESWKKRVDAHADAPDVVVSGVMSVSDDSEHTTPERGEIKEVTADSEKAVSTVKGRASARDPKDPSPLGFPVVKRHSLSSNAKMKDGGAGPFNQRRISPNKRYLIGASQNSINRSPSRGIADIPETSFLPPSFPSQLLTSTPNIKPGAVQKPAPIPRVPLSSPLTSPTSLGAYGLQRANTHASSSLPPFPPTFTSGGPVPSGNSKKAEKRPRSPSPERATKKIRMMASSELPASSVPLPPSTPALLNGGEDGKVPDSTPKDRVHLPTLTELLASSSKGKRSSPKRKKPRGSLNPDSSLIIRENRPASVSREASTVDQDPLPLDPHAVGMDLDLDVSFPKSLSSLAASDSDSDEERDGRIGVDFIRDGNEFAPMFTSTQVPFGSQENGVRGAGSMSSVGTTGRLHKTSSGLGWMGYNSQFDVNGRVDQVSKFMEKDVDYDRWLKDATPDLGDSVAQSQ